VDKYIIICFSICLLLTPAGQAENIYESHALDSLIQVALERNPTIQAANYKRIAADNRAEYAGWLPDPMLSAAVLNAPRTSLSLDETPMSSLALGLSQRIPWPGELSAKADIARLHVDIKTADLMAHRDNIVRQVTHYYYDYSYWTLIETVLAESQQLIGNIIEVAQTRYSNSSGSLQDVLRSKTSRARIENRILMARQKSSSALLRLAQLTDNPGTINHAFEPVLPAIPLEDVAVPIKLSNPILARASVGSALAKRKLDLAKSDYWPSLTVGIDYKIRKDMPMDAVSGEDFLSFKVGFNLPIWFFARQKNQTRAARQSYMAAQADERVVINSVERRVADIESALQSVRERADQYDRAILPQAQATGDAAQVAYEVGQVDFNGFLSAQLEVMNVELERLELLKQYHQQKAALRQLVANSQEVIK